MLDKILNGLFRPTAEMVALDQRAAAEQASRVASGADGEAYAKHHNRKRSH